MKANLSALNGDDTKYLLFYRHVRVPVPLEEEAREEAAGRAQGDHAAHLGPGRAQRALLHLVQRPRGRGRRDLWRYGGTQTVALSRANTNGVLSFQARRRPIRVGTRSRVAWTSERSRRSGPTRGSRRTFTAGQKTCPRTPRSDASSSTTGRSSTSNPFPVSPSMPRNVLFGVKVRDALM